MAAAKSGGRYGHRDATLILIAYRHGLRASYALTCSPACRDDLTTNEVRTLQRTKDAGLLKVHQQIFTAGASSLRAATRMGR
jgi:hypothetical protein